MNEQRMNELFEVIVALDIDEAKSKFKLALKEQDRDTRHACAERVLSVHSSFEEADVLLKRAHDMIMNCNEGLKIN